MQKVNHPNLLKLVDLKKTKSHNYLVMEFLLVCDLTGCLKKYMTKYRKPFLRRNCSIFNESNDKWIRSFVFEKHSLS